MENTRPRGRPKGSPNKLTADIKAAAQKFTDDALNTLAKIMRDGESEAARVAAANAILDRGYGKPKQSLDVDADVKAEFRAVEWRVVDPKPPSA